MIRRIGTILLLSLGVVSGVAHAEAPRSCEIETRLAFTALRFATPNGVVVRAFPEHPVAIRPRSGGFEVRFLEPVELVADPAEELPPPSAATLARRRRMAHRRAEAAAAPTPEPTGPQIAYTREDLRVVLRNAVMLDGGTVTLPSGARLLELLPTEQGVRARLEIADGVVVERVQLTCADLAIEAQPPATPDASEASEVTPPAETRAHPHVATRVTRVHLYRERDTGHSTAISLPQGFRFTELTRRADWVQVETRVGATMLRGWLRPWDLEDAPAERVRRQY